MRLERTVIGMVHLAPLPGSPRWDGSMARVAAAALADAQALIEGGVDAVLVENFGDAPFTPGRVEPATVAAVSVVAAEVRRAFPRIALGVKGASPKFSTSSASTPPSTSARASASAHAVTPVMEPSQRGLPGRGGRWTMPMIVRSSRISGSLA